jgi:hypothetical protein
MVSRVAVQEGQHRTSDSRIYHLIYSRKSEGILRTVFVEICIVDAHAHSTLFFLSTRIGFVSHSRSSTSLMNPGATK